MGRRKKKVSNMQNKESGESAHQSTQSGQRSYAVCPSTERSTLFQTGRLSLTDLPDDVLYVILSYLSQKDLCHVCCVSKRFFNLAKKDTVWIHHAKSCGVTKGYLLRRQCSAMEICRVSCRWRDGMFKQALLAREKRRQIPWLCKEDKGLWLSKGSAIHYFRSKPNGHLVEERQRYLTAGSEDLTRFDVKDKIMVSGCRDGSVHCWSTLGDHIFSYKQIHASDTHCVDFTESVVVSGSRDTTCKVMPFQDTHADNGNKVLHTFHAGERVWSLKISPNGRMFAAGLAGCLGDPPLIVWDLESGTCLSQLSVHHKRGAGVLDLKFESPNELLACGYDTFIRLWDLRTHSCVRQWEEPYDTALYCIETDGEDTMVVGTARHGMVRLWDKRHSDPIQYMYCERSQSPVYSLAMDYGHLYVALDTGLTVMDFT